MISTTQYDPFQHAEQLGIVVEWVYLPGDLYGLWTGEQILLDPRLTARQARCTLAHEIVHAELDQPLLHKSYAARVEKRADRIAAERLITPDQYSKATSIYDCPSDIAAELDVTQEMLTAYENSALTRT